MGKPTQEQLVKINRFARTPLSEENTYVFKSMMIDNQATSYYSKLSPKLLEKFKSDADKGIALLLNHNSYKLPVGRSYQSSLVKEYKEDGSEMVSLYGEFYMDLDRNTDSGINTTDLAKGIDSGAIFDTSIGFSASKWDCSICGNDIRNYMACEHIPSHKYAVNRNGLDAVETCYVLVGEDGQGALLENSLVYAGACDRATITDTQDFFSEQVSSDAKGSILDVINDFKKVPLNATIYSYYSQDSGVLHYTLNKKPVSSSFGDKKRSEEQVELNELKEVLEVHGFSVETKEELQTALSTFKEESTYKDEQLHTLSAEVEELKAKFEELSVKSSDQTTELTKLSQEKLALEAQVTELSAKAVIVDTYRADLVNATVEYGVRTMGNAFNAELFEKFLGTLSIDDIKAQLENFKSQFENKFSDAKTVEVFKTSSKRTDATMTKDSFETEEEFRAYVATEAEKYSRENKVSLVEATKLIYSKLVSN